MKEAQEDALIFIHTPKTPYITILAVRDIKMMNVRQRILGTFRSVQGAGSLCSVRAYMSTIAKINGSIVDVLEKISRWKYNTLGGGLQEE